MTLQLALAFNLERRACSVDDGRGSYYQKQVRRRVVPWRNYHSANRIARTYEYNAHCTCRYIHVLPTLRESAQFYQQINVVSIFIVAAVRTFYRILSNTRTRTRTRTYA